MTFLLRMKPVIAAAMICAVMLAICYFYVDKPVERFVWHHRHWDHIYMGLASPSLISLPAACLYFAFYALRRISGRPDLANTELCLTLCIAIAVATISKDELKWIIGRPWPIGWVRSGLYQFRPFTSDYYYGGLPSGHTTYVATPMFVLWWRLPRYRVIWITIIFLVMIGLVGAGYHWVGDVIAGFFLGLAAAAGTVAVRPVSGLTVFSDGQNQANFRIRRSL